MCKIKSFAGSRTLNYTRCPRIWSVCGSSFSVILITNKILKTITRIAHTYLYTPSPVIVQFIWEHENGLDCIQTCFSRIWFVISVKEDISFYRVTSIPVSTSREFYADIVSGKPHVPSSKRFLSLPPVLFFILLHLSILKIRLQNQNSITCPELKKVWRSDFVFLFIPD